MDELIIKNMDDILNKGRPRLTNDDRAHFKELLLKEREKVEQELTTVGHRNPNDPDDWVPNPDKMDVMEADQSERADRSEELGDNAAILNELEIRFNQIKRALAKIENGTYGSCEVGGDRIPKERLEANPAAMTCIEHETGLYKQTGA